MAWLLFVPVVVWNQRRDWISFAFQLGHGLGDSDGSFIARELTLLAGQAGVVTPVLFVLMAIAVASGLWARRESLRFALALNATVSSPSCSAPCARRWT